MSTLKLNFLFSVTLACALGLIAAPAEARRPFEDTDLFTGHSIRQSSKDRKIAAGINIHAAPVPFVARKALKDVVSATKSVYPDGEALLSVLEKSDAGKVNTLAVAKNVDGTKKQLRDDLKAANVTPTATQTKAIDNISASNIEQVEAITAVAMGQGSDGAFVFGLEPWAEYNAGLWDITAALPVAGFRSADGSSFSIGNLNVDARVGSRKSRIGAGGLYLPLAIGWTGGLSLYLPTGTQEANRVALSNVLVLPKYLHEYLTVQPYGIFGAEALIFAVQLRLEYTHMLAVRGNPAFDNVGYLNWAASLVTRAWLVDLVAEFDGLKEAYNAPAMNDIFATLGGRLSLGPVRLGMAARMPITTPSATASERSFGVSFANVAKFNLLLQGFLTF